MSSDSPYQMSQGLEVLPPKSGQAYPIPCAEWDLLRDKISRTTHEPWLFHTVGSALLGMALSAFLPIITDTFQLPAQQRVHDITWLVLIVSSICGAACLYFSHKERQIHRERTSDVVAQMQLIEQRYDRAP
jgi:Na+/melibiose symporter-like transporter